MKLALLNFALAVALAATPAAAQTASEPATSPAAPNGRVNGSEVVAAARSGDPAVMRRMTGASVTLQGRRTRTLRESRDYTDIGVFTGPDFKLAGGRSGLEVRLRVPKSLVIDPLPEQITASGSLTGFEATGTEPPGNPGDPNEVAWTPVITVDFLR